MSSRPLSITAICNSFFGQLQDSVRLGTGVRKESQALNNYTV
ncbi:hypothetical protein [Chlorobium phaeobacteroides]|nr:hypothetical protein [Chlorobium phaeobacteroides]